ncbi:hypothetical protein FRB95_003989 [Tulasnella sp. JGI-2019a]|nr:hypothetical protein FRB95_003989 [Tulasnella sp. JGI-2019a]
MANRLRREHQPRGPNFIRKLPNEILVDIFSRVAHVNRDQPLSSFSATRVPKLHVIARVCRCWHLVVRNAPELWTIVLTPSTLSSIYASLRLSRSHPLDVVVKPGGQLDNALLSTLITNIHRWRRVSIVFGIDASDDFDEFFKIYAEPDKAHHASTLEEFTMEVDFSGYFGTRAVDLFAGGAPRLKHLSLRHIVPRNWNSSVLRGLHTLSLVDIYHFEHPPSLQNLVDVLDGCPDLQCLKLQNVILSNTDDDLDSPHNIIHLPRLHTLHIAKMADRELTDITSRMCTPRCTSYFLDDNLCTNPLLAAIASMVSEPVQAELVTCQHIEIVLNTNLEVYLWTDNRRFSLLSPRIAELASVIRWITGLLKFARRFVPIHFSWEKKAIAPSWYQDFHTLRRLPCVVAISFIDCNADLSGFIHALNALENSEDGKQKWFWPELRAVRMHRCTCSPELLLELVTRRLDAAGTNAVVTLRKLEVLEGYAIDANTFEGLSRILGNGVTWKELPKGGRGTPSRRARG